MTSERLAEGWRDRFGGAVERDILTERELAIRLAMLERLDQIADERARRNGSGGNPEETMSMVFGEGAEPTGSAGGTAQPRGEGLPNVPPHRQLVDGASFVFDQPQQVPAIWGASEKPGWVAGEGLMMVGPQGVGKTTTMQQLTLGRCGIRKHFLGMPVEPDERPVLYIAADRPRQAARSLRRMVGDADADVLRERLLVWRGPLPFLLTDRDGPARFREFLLERGIGTVFIDSLKDVAAKLADDEGGSRINFALQMAIAEGIETCTGHHQRKATSDNKRPDKLADVYGSGWITAGQGSVFVLWGEAGDPVVRLDHLKQPLDEVGPFDVVHDHERGVSRLHEPPELASMLYDRGAAGMTVNDAATALFGPTPSKAQIEKARRKLRALPRTLEIPATALGDPARFVYDGGKEQGA